LAKDIPVFPGFLFFLCSLTRCMAPAPVTEATTLWRDTNVFIIIIIIPQVVQIPGIKNKKIKTNITGG